MTDREKQIEKIQNILPDIEVIKATYGDIDFSRYLYDHNCRIITEDSVVLTKGAYESISSKAKANVVNAVEIRKETAREIFNDIFALVNNAKDKSSKIFGNSSEYGKGYKNSVNHFNEHILELAKQYGVDIEE